MNLALSAGSEGSRIGSCKLREARSLISSVVNPGYSKITLKARDKKLDLRNDDRNGRSDSDLDDLDEGESQPRWTRCRPLNVCDQSNLLICSLTDKHRNAIRMVRKIKYFVARRKFQQVAGCLGMVGSVITLLPCVRLVSRMTCVM